MKVEDSLECNHCPDTVTHPWVSDVFLIPSWSTSIMLCCLMVYISSSFGWIVPKCVAQTPLDHGPRLSRNHYAGWCFNNGVGACSHGMGWVGTAGLTSDCYVALFCNYSWTSCTPATTVSYSSRLIQHVIELELSRIDFKRILEISCEWCYHYIHSTYAYLSIDGIW